MTQSVIQENKDRNFRDHSIRADQSEVPQSVIQENKDRNYITNCCVVLVAIDYMDPPKVSLTIYKAGRQLMGQVAQTTA